MITAVLGGQSAVHTLSSSLASYGAGPQVSRRQVTSYEAFWPHMRSFSIHFSRFVLAQQEGKIYSRHRSWLLRWGRWSLVRSARLFLLFLECSKKEPFWPTSKRYMLTSSKRKRLFKKSTDHWNFIRLLVSLCTGNCHPKVLQDVIAEGIYVKEMVSKRTL